MKGTWWKKKAKRAWAVAGWLAVCVPWVARAEALYFALELKHDGKVVGKPKLLGETGVKVRAERRQPGAARPDYRLVLMPVAQGAGYLLQVEVELPEAKGQSALSVVHAEERKVQLGRRPGELEVSLLLMRVDSPEFRALMELKPNKGESQPQRSI